MALRPCARPGCGNVVRSGYCAACKPSSPRARFEQQRGSSSQRGYDAVWQRFRAWFLRRHPLCVDCQAKRVITAANEVHHIVKVAENKELRLVESNCLALCHDCHSRRTQKGE